MVRPEWPYAAAREQILSDESGGCSGAGQVAGEARPSQGASPQANAERVRREADKGRAISDARVQRPALRTAHAWRDAKERGLASRAEQGRECALKAGEKLKEFAVQRATVSRKISVRKTRKRRRFVGPSPYNALNLG